jgi:hypothetical protein
MILLKTTPDGHPGETHLPRTMPLRFQGQCLSMSRSMPLDDEDNAPEAEDNAPG